MARNPRKLAATPADMGTVKQRLERPERVAELTHVEVSELKERRRLVERFEQEALDANRVVILLRNEYTKFASGLVTKYGLDESNDHNIDTENGAIWQTTQNVPVQPEVIDGEASEVETADAD